MKRLYVGNVPYDFCTDEGLREFFDGYPIKSTHIVMDKEQGRPRGFCFVEMTDPDAAQLAVEELDGAPFHGRTVTVRFARDKRVDRNEHHALSRRNERRARY